MPQVSKMNHSYLTTSYRFFSDLFYSSKEGSEVRAAPAVRKFGCQFCWLEELANARSGVSPLVAFETRAVKRPQGAAQ